MQARLEAAKRVEKYYDDVIQPESTNISTGHVLSMLYAGATEVELCRAIDLYANEGESIPYACATFFWADIPGDSHADCYVNEYRTKQQAATNLAEATKPPETPQSPPKPIDPPVKPQEPVKPISACVVPKPVALLPKPVPVNPYEAMPAQDIDRILKEICADRNRDATEYFNILDKLSSKKRKELEACDSIYEPLPF
jgi:hypothetical protein